MEARDFLVDRSNLRRTAIVAAKLRCEENEILAKVERFAVSANNLTYALLGTSVGYWDFFPADAPWGRIPVWSYACVMQSPHAALKPGDRLYGYFPMSTHLVMKPVRVRDIHLYDGIAHRAHLSPVYNHYARIPADAARDRRREHERMLLRPLFFASYLAGDLLAVRNPDECIVIASASSKVAIGLAHCLRASPAQDFALIGLTSDANLAFVRDLGIYDRVVAYGDIDALPRAITTIFDLSGNAELIAKLMARAGDDLELCCLVGYTHGQDSTGAETDDPRVIRFSAPDRIRQRMKDWGQAEFDRRFETAFESFAHFSRRWLRIVESNGPDVVATTYEKIAGNRVPPDEGHILSLWND